MINNRDLSWLNFNDRVLQEARDESVPLLQRLRFLGIFSNNLSEYVKVRVANIIRISKIKKATPFSGDIPAKELLGLVSTRMKTLQERFEQTYDEVICEMQQHGIFIVNESELNEQQTAFCIDYFSNVISPRLVPIALRKSVRLPFLSDNNIYHGVKMSVKGGMSKYAIIQIPVSRDCPRFVELPSDNGNKYIIYSDDIIRLCLDDIFFMFDYDEISAFTFKFIRDAKLTLDDDISKSLIEKLEEGLEDRQHGLPVRITYDRDMPDDLLQLILKKFNLKAGDATDSGGRYHQKRDLMKFPRINNALEYASMPPLQHPSFKPFSSVIEVIKKKDVLLNYPYHTFNHFIDFLREAAIDSRVTDIYISLYRTAEHSKVINALINAAKNGKNVVVVLELFARFDEEQNVENTERLQREGVKVINSANGLKVHGKLVHVVRREGTKLRGYTYIGTGNFNEDTAKIYSDFGLFTANQQFGNDARLIFDFLMNPHKRFVCKQLIVSPYDMRNRFEEMIAREIKNAAKGKKAYIYAKFNSLTDEPIVRLLYEASKKGVEVRLIIRGSFCLQPQRDKLSENIKAISIVDKYLEHARLLILGNGGNEQVYIMSADWMTRNLNRRVEVGAPVLDPKIKKTLRKFFDIQWADNVKARDLSLFGENNYIEPAEGAELVRSQVALYDFYNKMREKELAK